LLDKRLLSTKELSAYIGLAEQTIQEHVFTPEGSLSGDKALQETALGQEGR